MGAVCVCSVTQSCLTLCDPMDYSPPGSSAHGILQARNWSGLPFPSPGDLPNPGIKPRSPALQADALTSEPPGKSQVGIKWGKKIISIGILMLKKSVNHLY